MQMFFQCRDFSLNLDFLIILLHGGICNQIHNLRGQESKGILHHHVLDQFFADGFLLTPVLLMTVAGVVVVGHTLRIGAGVAVHLLPAVAAKEFTR